MANNFAVNPIVLDTFTSAISLYSSLGYRPFLVESIEWENPTTVGHTAVVTTDGTNTIFSETCTVQKQSILKEFHADAFSDIQIAISGVGSGKIIIHLR